MEFSIYVGDTHSTVFNGKLYIILLECRRIKAATCHVIELWSSVLINTTDTYPCPRTWILAAPRRTLNDISRVARGNSLG